MKFKFVDATCFWCKKEFTDETKYNKHILFENIKINNFPEEVSKEEVNYE
jgi:hypothetical protein